MSSSWVKFRIENEFNLAVKPNWSQTLKSRTRTEKSFYRTRAEFWFESILIKLNRIQIDLIRSTPLIFNLTRNVKMRLLGAFATSFIGDFGTMSFPPNFLIFLLQDIISSTDIISYVSGFLWWLNIDISLWNLNLGLYMLVRLLTYLPYHLVFTF
jgi:hypothetical protein